MNKELKRQLILSGILVCFIISTLFLWYNNFMFHTYVNTDDYQYCFAGGNEELSIDGYQFYKNKEGQKHGNARIIALKDQFLLKDDSIHVIVTSLKDKDLVFEHQLSVKGDNEVLTLSEDETKEKLSENDLTQLSVQIIIKRQNKTVYDQTVPLQKQDVYTYNGANKDYAISNVYVTSSWLKTGDFSSKIKNIEKQYNIVILF